MVTPAPLQVYENPFQIIRLALHDTPHLNMKQKPTIEHRQADVSCFGKRKPILKKLEQE